CESSGVGCGTVFAVNRDGTGFETLYFFSGLDCTPIRYCPNSDGAFPHAGLTLSGTTLYGTTSAAGSGGQRTVFAINTDGTGFTPLYSFSAEVGHDDTHDTPINSDGAQPYA